MTRRRRRIARLLLVAALVLALLGQYYFFRRREFLWDGLVFHVLAACCFVAAWWLSRPPQPHSAPGKRFSPDVWLREQPIPAALLALALFLSFAASLLSRDRPPDQSTRDVVTLWLSGVGALGLAALWPSSWPPRFLQAGWQRLKAGLASISRGAWLEATTIAALTALALVLRAAALRDVPYTLGGDEAWHGLLARQVLQGQLRNPFFMGYMSMPTLFYWPLSWSLWLVRDPVTALRLPAALVGAATVPLLYLFARDLWGRRVAFISALFLATYDYHIHYSRLGANNVWDALFVLLALWLLDRGLRGARGSEEAGEQEAGGAGATWRYFIVAGLVMGIGVYFYTGARLLPVLVAIYTAFVWVRRGRKVERMGAHLVLLVLAFLIVAGPMLSFALSHPNEWNARVNQVGILQSGWLAREPELTGKSTLYILVEQFLRAAGAFHVYPDRTFWYGAERPLLGFLPGLFALLGMAWALFCWRDRRYFLVLIWFWSVIITGGMLTESPPSSQRLVIAIPAVALLVAFGVEQVLRLARRLFEFERAWANLALGALVLLMAVGSVHFYFADFTPSRRYGSENGETATMIGRYLDGLEGRYRAYFFGAPRIYWGFGTMSFIAPQVPGQDFVEPIDAPPVRVDASRNAVFIFLPERAGELSFVQQAFPDGQLHEFRDVSGRLRFIAYEVPRPDG